MRTWVQHVIPFVGKGLTFPVNNLYNPGEFRELVNADIVPEGALRTRRRIVIFEDTSGPENYTINADAWFLGVKEDAPQAAELFFFQKGVTGPAFADTIQGYYHFELDGSHELFDHGSAEPVKSTERRFRKFYRYNNMDYYVAEKVTSATSEEISIYNRAAHTSGAYTITLTGYSGVYKESFIFKDRHFIFLGNQFIYSKATDPAKFAVADGGGFVIIPDETITHAFPVRDSIYILTKNSIYLFSFATDPSVDGVLTVVSPNMGAEYGTTHQSIPYIINSTGLYTIMNNYVEKVCDMPDVSYFGYSLSDFKLLEFDDTLLILAGQGPGSVDNNLNRVYQMLAYNIETQSLSRWHFIDHGAASSANQGSVRDAIVIKANGRDHLLIVTYRVTTAPAIDCEVYVMDSDRNHSSNQDAYDRIQNAAGKTDTSINHTIELVNIIPDGLRWSIKKFRHLIFEGRFPNDKVTVQAGFHENRANYANTVYSRSKVIEEASFTGHEDFAPGPIRFNLMQRAKQMFLKITGPTALEHSADGGSLMLEKAYLIWSPTSRVMNKTTESDTA
jgi:hypothetical protein